MEDKTITVTTRNEFQKLMREIFIPSIVKDNLVAGFNIGYGMNNWDTFWCDDKDKHRIIVNLVK